MLDHKVELNKAAQPSHYVNKTTTGSGVEVGVGS